jgi:hypothetical protein
VAEILTNRVDIHLTEQPFPEEEITSFPHELSVLRDALQAPVAGKSFFGDFRSFNKRIYPPVALGSAAVFDIRSNRINLVHGVALLVITWRPLQNNRLQLF